MIPQSERRRDSPDKRKAQKESRAEQKKQATQQAMFPYAPIH